MDYILIRLNKDFVFFQIHIVYVFHILTKILLPALDHAPFQSLLLLMLVEFPEEYPRNLAT